MSLDSCSRRASLLPAFEPLSSSPGQCLPAVTTKRKFDDRNDDRQFYPTPVPTSSTGFLQSSPQRRSTRPGLQRNVSSLSERAPLSTVPTLNLQANGEPVHMGRSSNSSDYQLSSNRLISRVHVRATYLASSKNRPRGEVLVECLGWNGCKVHVGGRVVELAKEDSFRSDNPNAQIIVDVQDTRVQLAWPGSMVPDNICSSPPAVARSPSKRRALDGDFFGSSPPAQCAFLRSPSASRSPIRAIRLIDSFSATFREEKPVASVEEIVRVYEDVEESKEISRCQTPTPAAIKQENASELGKDVARSLLTKAPVNNVAADQPYEHDNENNPAVQNVESDNILSGFQELSPTSPQQAPKPMVSKLTAENSVAKVSEGSTEKADFSSPLKNHVINQLAFSRVHSLPLSTIYANLPVDLKSKSSGGGESKESSLSEHDLRSLLHEVPCIGEISREGKDAAGKQLEDEFYYVQDLDSSEDRRNAISVSKPPIRNVRKQHKQYYWKRPRA